MPRQKISKAAQYLLGAIERLTRKEYERVISPRFRRNLTREDLRYLRNLATEELERRTQASPSSKYAEARKPASQLSPIGDSDSEWQSLG